MGTAVSLGTAVSVLPWVPEQPPSEISSSPSGQGKGLQAPKRTRRKGMGERCQITLMVAGLIQINALSDLPVTTTPHPLE